MTQLLIFAPFLLGLLLLIPKPGLLASALAVGSVLLQAGLAIAFALGPGSGLLPVGSFELPFQEYLILAVELLLVVYFVIAAVRSRRLLPLVLALVQGAITIAGEGITSKVEVATSWTVDGLAVLMVLVIGIVGGLIVLYSLGYMRRFHKEHAGTPDRRSMFTAVFMIFLGAMYGLVLTNDLRLMLLFWEITTWASFVLIGYSKDKVSEKSAFLALSLNLVGGIAFAVGNLFLASTAGTLELSALGGLGAGVAAIPVACIALAGLVKSAQLPFTPWLLGAMVAPTPVSALLHSSTMVKAGVFLLLRLSPALAGRLTGDLVALVGILTFLLCAFMAVAQRNSKRVLALSTVSNLGLIVVCAGIGTPQLLWAGFFLILFHAVAKALLFLGVGTASLGTGSLDIEEMGGLIVTMPRLALLMFIGIAGMFVAPFGMLISKWTVMEAFIAGNSPINPVILACLAWGSATTVLFWTKWMGTLIRTADPSAPTGSLEAGTSRSEGIAEGLLAFIAIVSFAAFPLASSWIAEPWLRAADLPFAPAAGNVALALAMVSLTVLLPALLVAVSRSRTKALSTAYMSGRSNAPGLLFKGSAGAEKAVALRSVQLEGLFGEGRLLPIGIVLGTLLAIIMLGTVIV
ncbi:MAG: NADH-quinone oxidoreductase subunit L [Rectinemataceae bacterium]